MSTKFIYLILVVMLVFMVVEFLFVTIGRRAPFEIVYYRSNLEYDYDGNATFTTVVGLYFKDERKREEYKNAYLEASKEGLGKYFQDISKQVGREIVPYDYTVKMEEKSGVLEVTEKTFLKGAAEVKDGVVDTGMGNLTIGMSGETEIVVKIPEDAVLISAVPTPTVLEGNVLVWRPKESIPFPKVTFRKGSER